MLWNYLEREAYFDGFECSNCGYVVVLPEGEALPHHCPNCGEESEVEGE